MEWFIVPIITCVAKNQKMAKKQNQAERHPSFYDAEITFVNMFVLICPDMVTVFYILDWNPAWELGRKLSQEVKLWQSYPLGCRLLLCLNLSSLLLAGKDGLGPWSRMQLDLLQAWGAEQTIGNSSKKPPALEKAKWNMSWDFPNSPVQCLVLHHPYTHTPQAALSRGLRIPKCSCGVIWKGSGTQSI